MINITVNSQKWGLYELTSFHVKSIIFLIIKHYFENKPQNVEPRLILLYL